MWLYAMLAWAYARKGNYALARAFELLEESYRQHSANLAYIKPDPFWENLHSDSRYPNLLRRMGLAQ